MDELTASIIIPVWNGQAHLSDCLNALLAQERPPLEIIAVDNASQDGSAQLIQERYPQVQLIRNPRNLGFSGGCNAGLRAAHGDVLVLLNQDTVVAPAWLQELLRVLEEDPAVGVVGGKAVYPDGRIQHAGGYVTPRGEAIHYSHGQTDSGYAGENQDVDYVTGAGLAITRRALDAVGFLDEGFWPGYYEDVDWCFRVRRAGFRVVYAPRAVMVHKEASVTATPDHPGLFQIQRNRLRFVLKQWPLEKLRDEFLPAEQAWLRGAQESPELVAALHHSYLHHLLGLEELLSHRQGQSEGRAEAADVLAQVLVSLRATAPALAAPEPSPGAANPSDALLDALAELRDRQVVQERWVQPQIPLVGPLLWALRRLWSRLVTAAYVLPLVEQQNAFNAQLVDVLDRVVQQLSPMDERTDGQGHGQLQTLLRHSVEGSQEVGRELAELAQAIRELRSMLASGEKNE